MFLGSVTEKVIRTVTCPTLVVPPRAPDVAPDTPVTFRHILCPTDFLASSLKACEYAISVAEEWDAQVTLVHVVEMLAAVGEAPPVDDPYARLREAAIADARATHPEGRHTDFGVRTRVMTRAREPWTLSRLAAALSRFGARHVGEDVVEGLPVHKYEQVIPPTKTQTLDAPASVMGVEDETGDVKVDRWYDGKVTFWVEPTSGLPVKQEQQRHEVLKTQDGVERKPALVATATYTPETVDEMVRTATDAKNQINLLKSTIPLVLLVVGVVLLIAGVLFVLRGGRSARHAAQ